MHRLIPLVAAGLLLSRAIRAESLAAVLGDPTPAPRAEADILCLKDGRVIQGPTTKDGRVIQGPAMKRVDDGIDLVYAHGTVHVPKELILDAVLADDSKIEPRNEEERQQSAKGFVRFEGKWITAKQRDDLVAKRVEKHRKLLEEMRAHGEWAHKLVEPTRYFKFQYTVPQHVFEPYRDAMEAYFAQFMKDWKIKPPKAEDRLSVCFYGDETEFHQVAGIGQGVLGYYKPDPANRDLNIFYERLDPELSEDIMFHESNHYLQSLINPRFWIPHFPGESLAEYYGASEWDPLSHKLTTGLIQEGRLCEVDADAAGGESWDIVKLISTEGLYEHYTWGWALVHFLMSDARYAAKFQRFFLALPDAKGAERIEAAYGTYTISGEDVMKVFMKEMGLKDNTALRKLEAEWHDDVEKKRKQFVTCSGKERAGFKAKEVGRKLRATRLFNEAIAMGSKNPLVYHELALLYAEDGKRSEAFAMWDKATALDPLEGQFYTRRAFFVEDSDKKEAQRLRDLAKDIGYDDPWVHIELGEADADKPGDKPGEKPGDKPGDKPN